MNQKCDNRGPDLIWLIAAIALGLFLLLLT